MSKAIIFLIGSVVFAITVYGAVMAGGLLLTRRQLDQDDELAGRVAEGRLDAALPVDVGY